MDHERLLDEQLEELNAKLNHKDNDESGGASDTNTSENSEKERFLTDSLNDFVSPEFKATLEDKTGNIDVTTGNLPKEVNIDDILANARKDVEGHNAPDSSTATTEQSEDGSLANIDPDIDLVGPGRLNMSEMRLDVAKISADIQGGEELYRRALQRVEGLMGFVEKAEVDFSVLNRLEPENRRLKARIRTSNGEVEGLKAKVSLISADLEDHQERLDEKTKQYEDARGKLTKAAKSLRDYEGVLRKSRAETDSHALALERHKTALSVEGKENKVLREKISELSSALELRQTEYLEASKMVESLRADCADFRDQADTFRTEAQELRITLNTAKRQNNAMKGEMQTLHEDIKTFKTQYEFNVINREDKVTDLETKISSLSREIDQKTELANTATRELAALRKIRSEQDIERNRLEKRLAAAQSEMRDVTSLAEKRSTEQTKELQTTIRDLQREIARRDEEAEHQVKERAELRDQFENLTMERDSLQSNLDQQSRRLEGMMINDPTSELEAQIRSLQEQLNVKDDIVKSAAHDVSELRKAHKEQQAEKKRLEDLIHTQTYQLEEAQKALFEAKQAESELDKKYKDIAAALSMNQTRRRTESPSSNPDISPDISKPDDSVADEIENKIMDYKFGISKDIV
ncbi:coiled-coil domain-containing protein [Hellea balneolensis]|uniref:hypothetical protein n=1 Tax=Hellea balneolensis TaxID=287478 RepID=UPI0012B7D79F|nr:hypothetical protein [Hellea balneolensis]